MNLPRPTRTTAILSLCLAILAGMLGYEHHQLSQLSNSLAATADKESLDALLTRLGAEAVEWGTLWSTQPADVDTSEIVVRPTACL